MFFYSIVAIFINRIYYIIIIHYIQEIPIPVKQFLNSARLRTGAGSPIDP
jgi:hypothetical protein